MILAIKTDSEIAEMYIVDDTGRVVKRRQWLAKRELAKNLLREIKKFLDDDFKKVNGLIVFRGPGSFTGLRIGITVMNAISYSGNVPIFGSSGKNWLKDGVKKVLDGQNNQIVTPDYGCAANTTTQRK